MATDQREQSVAGQSSRSTNGAAAPALHRPLGLLAELTHRCPLGCPYCSNPLALDARERELDTQTWARVFEEAATLGVLQVHLSGGEPGARRDLVEITPVQYYGWALRNRESLMATADQVPRAVKAVEELRKRYDGKIVIDAVLPDYYARFPKPCVGGWGRRSLNVTPAGKVLPCHAAETIPGLEFWSVRERSPADIWHNSPAFPAFRGTDWMQEPCPSCPRRFEDFGGCRCQAFALTGDARATDPVCHLSPKHAIVAALAEERREEPYVYRRLERERADADTTRVNSPAETP